MSRENVEALRAVYEGWARGDFRTGMDLYDPHILLVTRPDLPDAGQYAGLEEIRGFMRRYLEPLTDVTWTAEEFIEAEGSVVVVSRERGAGAHSGIALGHQLFAVWTFRGEAVIRIEFFPDRAKALEAVGLRE